MMTMMMMKEMVAKLMLIDYNHDDCQAKICQY